MPINGIKGAFMLDVEKIRLMTELARYETAQDKEDLKVSRYYRSDYIGIGLLKNLMLITVGYMLLWGLLVAYNLDYLLDNLHKVNFTIVVAEVIIGYLIVVAAYSVLTYISHYSRYEKAKKSVKKYYANLEELTKVYDESDQDKRVRKAGRKEE